MSTATPNDPYTHLRLAYEEQSDQYVVVFREDLLAMLDEVAELRSSNAGSDTTGDVQPSTFDIDVFSCELETRARRLDQSGDQSDWPVSYALREVAGAIDAARRDQP